MAITRQNQPIHLVNQNKHIRFWYCQLAHFSNTRVVSALKLINNIDLNNNNKKCIPAKVLIDLNDSDISELLDPEKPLIQFFLAKTILTKVVRQIKTKNSNVFNKLCILCVESKSTWIIRHNKSMTAITNKLEEVHTDL